MKLIFLLLVGFSIAATIQANAQTHPITCDSLEAFTLRAIKDNDFKKATIYLSQKEKHCDSFGQDDWDRLIGCLKNVVFEEVAGAIKEAYLDTLIAANIRMEAAGFYYQQDDLQRGWAYTMLENPDLEMADFYFQRGINAKGKETDGNYFILAYYTTYLLYYHGEGEVKANYKKRLFHEYFDYFDLIESARAASRDEHQQTLTAHFNYVFPSCDSILLEVPNFVYTEPNDTALTLNRIQRIESFLSHKFCTENAVYVDLIDSWLNYDSTSFEANYIKAQILNEDPLEMIDRLMKLTDDSDRIAVLTYEKAKIQFIKRHYHDAYATGLSCTGNYQKDGFYISAKSVAALANACGNTTFERKCNFIYAAELAEQAGRTGPAAVYRSAGPQQDSCDESNKDPLSIKLLGRHSICLLASLTRYPPSGNFKLPKE